MSGRIYVYLCPVCKKRFRSDSPYEPCCTGPSENRDDHEMTVMMLESVTNRSDVKEVSPLLAKLRAQKPLIFDPEEMP